MWPPSTMTCQLLSIGFASLSPRPQVEAVEASGAGVIHHCFLLQGWLPSAVSWRTLIAASISCEEMPAAATSLQAMAASKIQPDAAVLPKLVMLLGVCVWGLFQSGQIGEPNRSKHRFR